MDSFKLTIPEIGRSLVIEPAAERNTYRIYDDKDSILSELEKEEIELELEEIADNPLLGVLQIKNPKEFSFEGKGILSGDDMRFLINFLANHPSFIKDRQ